MVRHHNGKAVGEARPEVLSAVRNQCTKAGVLVMDSDQVWRRLAEGLALDGLALSRIDGRWNLRSLGSPQRRWSRKDPLPTINRVLMKSLDFSGSTLPHFRFIDCRFVDCIFDEADLSDWRLWDSVLVESSFRDAKLKGANMGGDQRGPNRWSSIDFSRSDLRGTAHGSESYDGCDFSRARLDQVNFEGSRHTGSRFAGRIGEVEFRAAPKGAKRVQERNCMRGVDLGDATVRFCSFNQIDLSECIFPSAPEHLRFDDRGQFARRVLGAARDANNDNPWLRVMMETHVRDVGEGTDGPGFQHESDLGESADEIAEAVRLMRLCGARQPGR